MAVAAKKKNKKSKSINLQPLGDRIVAVRDETEDVTSGGIYLPESAKGQATACHRRERGRRKIVGRRKSRRTASQSGRSHSVYLLRPR